MVMMKRIIAVMVKVRTAVMIAVMVKVMMVTMMVVMMAVMMAVMIAVMMMALPPGGEDKVGVGGADGEVPHGGVGLPHPPQVCQPGCLVGHNLYSSGPASSLRRR